jgi:HEAT repeat protein
VLVRWLPQISDRSVKEDLIRALSVPWAKAEAEPILQQEFRRLPGEQDPTGTLRWAIGNALETMADRSSFDSLADLARDRQFGTAREMIVLALAKTNDPRAVDILLELLDDPDVVVAALGALGKLKATNARDAIAKLTDHVNPEVAKEAEKALSMINK